VTDIVTGWTENRSVPNKARRWVIEALEEVAKVMPFPVIGADSDNGSEFIHHHLLDWCERRQITFTRSRPVNSNDGAHVKQKNWAVVRTVVGYHRYDTAAELTLLNEIWLLQSQMTNYFLPQQKLISKVRDGAKVTKKYDKATTPHPARRAARSRHRRGQGDPRRHLPRPEPRRDPTPDPSAHRAAPDPDHQQAPPSSCPR
jgi:hypothetical protein